MQKNSSSQDIGTNNLQWKLFIKQKNSHDCNSDGKTIFMQPQRDRMEIKIFEFGEKPGWSVSKAHVDGLALKIFRWNFFSEKRKFSFGFCFIIRVYNYFDMYCQRNFMLYVIMSSFYKLKLKPALFFTIDFLPSSIYISYNVNWQFCKWSVFTTCIGINTDIYVLYKLRFTLECMKDNCPLSW